MICVENALERVAPDILLDTKESYCNARLENEETDYLSDDHIEQLLTDSHIDFVVSTGKTEKIAGVGELRHYAVMTAQGYTHEVVIAIPKVFKSNIPVIGTSAWFTDTEGHNERVIRNVARAGSTVIFVGAEGSGRIKQTKSPDGPITLANSAATVLSVTKLMSEYILAEQVKEDAASGVARSDSEYIDTVNRYLIGESRGGMVGMGIIALEDAFHQKILGADLTAPCLPRKIRGMKEVVKLTNQVRREPGEMSKLVGKLGLSRLVYYPKTIRKTRQNLRHQIVIGGALFSGEAGALAKKIKDTSKLIHMTAFKNDFASMIDEWENIFEGFGNVHVTPLEGGHMTIADYETLQFVIGRLKAFHRCMDEGRALTRRNVFTPAHSIAENQVLIGHEAIYSDSIQAAC